MMINKINSCLNRFYKSKYDVKLKIFWVECISLFFFALICSIILNYLSFQPMRLALEIIFMILTVLVFSLSFHKKKLDPYRVILFFICNLFIILLVLILQGISKITVFSYFTLNIIFTITGFDKKEEVFFLFLETLLYGVVISSLNLQENDIMLYTTLLIQLIISTTAIMICFSIILKMYEEKAKSLEKINQELRSAALKDPLTNLWNRNYMNYFLDELISTNIEMSIIMFDIDYFKSINDQYGHPVGDEVLKEFSKIILKIIPKNAVAIRYGGEEFLVIAPNMNLNECKNLAEKIRKSVEEKLKIKEMKKTVTISGGVCEFNKNMNKNSLIKKADENLYIAKNNGRNKIVS